MSYKHEYRHLCMFKAFFQILNLIQGTYSNFELLFGQFFDSYMIEIRKINKYF